MRPRRIKALILLLLFVIFVSSGPVEGVNSAYKLHKHVIRENPRKLLQLYAVLDYDNAGPNTKHEEERKAVAITHDCSAFPIINQI